MVRLFRCSPGHRRVSAPSARPHTANGIHGRGCGIEHDAGTRRTVRYQSLGVASLAWFGVSPALYEIGQHLRDAQSAGVAPWAFLLLWVGLVQLAYAVYLVQLADWSSVWVAAHACLLVTVFYAVGLGVGLSAEVESDVIVKLGLADRHHAGQLTGWCLIMVSLSLLVAYLLGRFGLRWHRRYLLTYPLSNEGAQTKEEGPRMKGQGPKTERRG